MNRVLSCECLLWWLVEEKFLQQKVSETFSRGSFLSCGMRKEFYRVVSEKRFLLCGVWEKIFIVWCLWEDFYCVLSERRCLEKVFFMVATNQLIIIHQQPQWRHICLVNFIIIVWQISSSLFNKSLFSKTFVSTIVIIENNPPPSSMTISLLVLLWLLKKYEWECSVAVCRWTKAKFSIKFPFHQFEWGSHLRSCTVFLVNLVVQRLADILLLRYRLCLTTIIRHSSTTVAHSKQ